MLLILAQDLTFIAPPGPWTFPVKKMIEEEEIPFYTEIKLSIKKNVETTPPKEHIVIFASSFWVRKAKKEGFLPKVLGVIRKGGIYAFYPPEKPIFYVATLAPEDGIFAEATDEWAKNKEILPLIEFFRIQNIENAIERSDAVILPDYLSNYVPEDWEREEVLKEKPTLLFCTVNVFEPETLWENYKKWAIYLYNHPENLSKKERKIYLPFFESFQAINQEER